MHRGYAQVRDVTCHGLDRVGLGVRRLYSAGGKFQRRKDTRALDRKIDITSIRVDDQDKAKVPIYRIPDSLNPMR